MIMLWIKMWTESRGRLLTYLLVEGIRSKRSLCMQFFFFLMSTRHAYLRSRKYGDSSHVFLRIKGFGSWLMFSEDQGFLDLDSCFQRTQDFGLWLMFSEDQRFGILAHVFRGLRVSRSWLMFSEDLGFWILAHVFRGPKIFGL